MLSNVYASQHNGGFLRAPLRLFSVDYTRDVQGISERGEGPKLLVSLGAPLRLFTVDYSRDVQGVSERMGGVPKLLPYDSERQQPLDCKRCS